MLHFSKQQKSLFDTSLGIKESSGKYEQLLIAKAKRYLAYVQWIPGIKMIGVGNSVAMNSATEDSDIDLFIITEQKRMWFVRICITLFFSLLCVRKTQKKHTARFCLSFFMTDRELSLKNISIENDIYLYFWILHLKPIVDFDGTYKKFMESNMLWCDFSGYNDILEKNKDFIAFIGKSYGRGNTFLNFINTFLKKIFLPRTLKSYEKLGKPFGVVITDNMLKFHDKDKREVIRDSIVHSSLQ